MMHDTQDSSRPSQKRIKEGRQERVRASCPEQSIGRKHREKSQQEESEPEDASHRPRVALAVCRAQEHQKSELCIWSRGILTLKNESVIDHILHHKTGAFSRVKARRERIHHPRMYSPPKNVFTTEVNTQDLWHCQAHLFSQRNRLKPHSAASSRLPGWGCDQE